MKFMKNFKHILTKKQILSIEECNEIKKFILENEEKIKTLGLDTYPKTSENSLTGRHEVYNYLYNLPGDILIPKLKKILIKNKIKFPIKIKCWANIFRKNEGIEQHKHNYENNFNFFCANLFIDGDEEIGTTFIIKDRPIKHKNKKGEIIFFSDKLEHYVDKNNSNNIRISMALDFYPFNQKNKKIKEKIFFTLNN